MGTLGRLVPWATWEEWRQVGEWLLSADAGHVQTGIDRVAAWRSRGRLPLGVDITACLVETQARDPQASPCTAPQDPLPDSQLRLQYAMALVRMVNGIADSSQKGRVAASVASLATAAGLPRILVDLRHESTHNELPSAASLRLAAAQALAWLQANYWQRQAEHLGACRAKIGELVQEYVSLHVAAAAKVAAHAEAAAGSEGEEEGLDHSPTPAPATATVAAAAAAAAAALTGRKSGSKSTAPPLAAAAVAAAAAQAGTGAGAERGEAAAGSGSGCAAGYSAAEGQRRRRVLLAELKMGVPCPAASFLVDPLLDAGASDATLSAAGGGAAAVERGLATALPHFTKEWPQLPGLLLRAAVGRLAACATAAAAAAAIRAAAGGTAPAAESAEEGEVSLNTTLQGSEALGACERWVGRLLPAPQGLSLGAPWKPVAPAVPKGAAAAAAAGIVPRWVPSPTLLQELVLLCLPALASASHRAWLNWVEFGSGGSGSSGGGSGEGGAAGGLSPAAAAAAAVLSALHLLLDAWSGSACAGAGALAQYAALAAQAELPPTGHQTQLLQQQRRGQQHGAKDPAGPGAESNGEEPGVEAALEQLKEAAEQVSALGQKRVHAGVADRARGAKRWCRAARWAPCALGNLPSASDPNGRPAQLDAPAPLLAPSSTPVVGVASPAEVAAGAGVAAAPAVADNGTQEEQAALGEATTAAGVADCFGGSDMAAVADQHVVAVGEWPLDDGRLAWATAGRDNNSLAVAEPLCAQAPQLHIPPLQLLL